MVRSTRATVAMLAVVAQIGIAGCAQEQVTATPANCGEAVKQAWDNIGLRVQHDVGNTSRESAKAHLYLAEQASSASDEKECWRQFNWSKYLVR
ncbi:MAG TPA: hypothetical protein VGB82_07490 [Alphaproteobacteria bacterium]